MAKRSIFSKTKRMEVFSKFSGHCAYCGCVLLYENLTIDHVIPKWHKLSDKDCQHGNIIRGTDDIHNLFPACKRCNSRKSTLGIEEFREVIKLSAIRLVRDAHNYNLALDFGLIKEVKDKDGKFEVDFYFEKCLRTPKPLVLKTSYDWLEEAKYQNTLIPEPNGWDRANYHISFYHEKITEQEFEKRLNASAIQKNN